MRRVGGTAAIVLGAVYLLIGVLYFLLPEGQQGGAASVLESLATDGSTVYVTQQWMFALSGALGFAVVGGIGRLFAPGRAGAVHWANAFGYLGFAVTIVDSLRNVSFVYDDVPRFFLEADEQVQTVIAGDFATSSVDPQGWLTFGALGLWLLAVSIVALSDRVLPAAAGAVGLGVAAGYWLVTVGIAVDVEVLITIAAALAIVLAPVFYVWAGLVLRRRGPEVP